MPQRTEKQVRDEIGQVTLQRTLAENEGQSALARRCEARLQELRKELREVDDTPVVPYRHPSSPPSAPRGRPRAK